MFAELGKRRVAWVAVDVPELLHLFPTRGIVTNPELFYVRFHGCNALDWRSGNMQKQFDDDFSHEELEPWSERLIPRMTEQSSAGYFFSNPVRGQAPENVLLLKEQLAGQEFSLAHPGLAKTETMQDDAMCGRFVGFRKLEELKQYFPIDQSHCETSANYNVAPTHEILAIAQLNGTKILDTYHWGLVPFWAKDKSVGYKLINARAETVATKPSFREAFKKRRCLIIADGFYEWSGSKGNRQPMFITLPDKSPFAFAGLWESWHDKEKPGEVYKSCAIITRQAEGAIKALHHRMPVILHPQVYDSWLDPENHDQEALGAILQTKALTELVFHPVAKQVNSVRNNDPSNIKPVQTEFEF